MPTLPRGRCALLRVICLVTVVAVLTTGTSAGAGTAPNTSTVPPAAQSLDVDPDEPTIIWGATARPRGGEDWIDAVVNLEARLGRPLAATRLFLLWDSYFPNNLAQWAKDTDHLPVISVNGKRGSGAPVLWRDIANAQRGSTLHNEILNWANRIKAFEVPVYFTFNHEPEAAASDPNGSDEDFIAAWRKIINVFRGQGVTNAKYLWIMTGWSFWVDSTDPRQAIKWYPGDGYVDALGSDEYNDYTCRYPPSSWKSLATDIEPFRQFGLEHPNEELWLPEFGSIEDGAVPGRKGQWFNDVRAMFKDRDYAQFRGIVYFHAYREGTPCDWWVDSSASSLGAFRAMGHDVFYTRTYEDEPPPPPPDGSALLVVGSTSLGDGDLRVRARLTAAGYAVTVVDDSIVSAGHADGKDLVVVSSTSDDRLVQGELRDVATPVLIWKATLYDDMGMAMPGGVGIELSTSVSIVDTKHPLAAGRSGSVEVIRSVDFMPWAIVGAAADVVATIGGRAALFAYETGDQMAVGGTAAGCRVGFPAYHTSPEEFTAAGRALFDAALAWADDCAD